MLGEVIADRYELEELVGSGGMSSVFRAHDRLLDRYVALKVLHEHFADDDESVERFRREARSVAQLSHPHIVTVIDRGEADGRQFIVFEYVDGENLKQLAGRSGALPIRRAVEIAVAVADGLAFAHANGLVHRDVKPQNVLLNGEGEVKVTDFGIARSIEVDRGVTQTGTVLGTSSYISPEQAGGKPVSPATDVYSLGVVLWELLTGDVPFPGENFVAVALRHINEIPPSLADVRPDVPPRLAAAVDRALAKDPGRRFPTMEAFAAELRSCLDELEGLDPERTLVGVPAVRLATPRPATLRPERRRASRLPLAVALLALFAVAGIVAGMLALDGHRRTAGHGATGGSGGGSGAPVRLQAAGSYDPPSDGGDGSEDPQHVGNATDGSPATYWSTDTYTNRSFGNLKPGVGLVLDAGGPVALKRLTVTTDTPGMTAQVYAGDSATGPFHDDSASQTLGATTAFALSGATARYYVVWITQLPPGDVAHVNEVTASR